ncbi:MAG TPA: hypothetical protein VM285_09390 [Polyangia bacterium]|nr:hypothetical protein [Polyangia bacterium]
MSEVIKYGLRDRHGGKRRGAGRKPDPERGKEGEEANDIAIHAEAHLALHMALAFRDGEPARAESISKHLVKARFRAAALEEARAMARVMSACPGVERMEPIALPAGGTDDPELRASYDAQQELLTRMRRLIPMMLRGACVQAAHASVADVPVRNQEQKAACADERLRLAALDVVNHKAIKQAEQRDRLDAWYREKWGAETSPFTPRRQRPATRPRSRSKPR